MKQIVLILFLCIAGWFFLYKRDVIIIVIPIGFILDSKDGHRGIPLKMKKAGDVTAGAEAVSKPGYETGDWMPAVVPYCT